MFASRAASRPARTAAVAVAVAAAAGYCRDGSWKRSAADDRPADRSVAVPTAGNRCRSRSGVAGRSTVVTVVAPYPAAGRLTADRVAPAGAAGERPGPFPRASCPAPPASRVTCTARNPDHRICPDLVPPRPEKRRECCQKVETDLSCRSFELSLSNAGNS